jgi:hypothetical protein
MRRPRLRSTLAALALLLLAVLLAVGVPRASAITPFPTDGLMTLSNDHFTVHYNGSDGDTTCANFITEEQAGDILGMLDRAWKFYAGMKDAAGTNLGWPAPVPDTDAHVHVSIDNFSTGCLPYGDIPFGTPTPWDRWDALVEPIGANADNIHLNLQKNGLEYPVIAHEVFQLIEDAMAPGVDQWLQEGTAEWAAIRANKAVTGFGVNPDRTLECVGTRCGDTEYDKNGYPGWMLFEYLAERYGDQAVKDLWDRAQAVPLNPGTDDLEFVLQSHGTSLAPFFNAYTTARMTGDFTLTGLVGSRPEVWAEIPVGATSGNLPDTPVAVNHMAVRYVTLSHGSDATVPCFAADLTLNVEIPVGVVSTPTYYENTTSAVAKPLTFDPITSIASITVPWNTCAGSPNAYLSLPNDTLGLDGREFTVKGSVNVKLDTPATATAPPPGVHVIGTVVQAPTGDPAPTLKVYAPEVLRVSTKTRLLRFVVFSSGDGKLAATLGATGLGSASLRPGNNDIRFVLPTQLFKSLRTKSASNVLSLTSQSPSGTKGTTFTRRVVVQVPPKPKKKATKKH